MADEHHEDHGNTVAAWFLTLSWIVLWSVAGVAIILGGDLMLWTAVGLGGSVVFAVIAGVMKKAGLGRKTRVPSRPRARSGRRSRPRRRRPPRRPSRRSRTP